MMFDQDSPFLSRGVTGAWPERLNWRYENIFRRHLGVFDGKSVLDLGCNDGRWIHAALAAGAQHVLGVDGRAANLTLAEANLTACAYARSRYRLMHADLREPGAWEQHRADTVMMLGVLYHLPAPIELLRRVAAMRPSQMVIDTAVSSGRNPTIQLYAENTEIAGNGLGDGAGTVIVGHPSESALSFALEHYGYSATVYRWGEAGADVDSRSTIPTRSAPLRDYQMGRRVLIIADRRDWRSLLPDTAHTTIFRGHDATV